VPTHPSPRTDSTLGPVFRIGTKPTWPRLRDRVAVALDDAFASVTFDISGGDAEPRIAWHLGPPERAVAATIGDVPGWTLVSALGGPDPDAPPSGAVLLLERTVSQRALAGAVVRYRAANPRPYDASSPSARRRLWAILDEDDPERSGYPLSDAMAELLLASCDGAQTAAALADRLEVIGFDALWNRAWASTPL
jgi:hypothetical protein